jgi:hypothetical protein
MRSSVMQRSTGSAVRLGEGRDSLAPGWIEGKGIDRAETQIGFLRFYDPNLQRWPNRDPIAEAGSESLRHALPVASLRWLKPLMVLRSRNGYQFIENSPLMTVDSLGLHGTKTGCDRNRFGPPCAGPLNGQAGPQDNVCSIPGGTIVPYYWTACCKTVSGEGATPLKSGTRLIR